ncbi:hypothetical protein R6Q57_010016 [Mikania cordata]
MQFNKLQEVLRASVQATSLVVNQVTLFNLIVVAGDITNDSTKTSDDQNDITNDAYSKVKGPEKRGYIRLVGKMSTEKNNGPSEESETINKLKSAVNALAMIISLMQT